MNILRLNLVEKICNFTRLVILHLIDYFVEVELEVKDIVALLANLKGTVEKIIDLLKSLVFSRDKLVVLRVKRHGGVENNLAQA